MQCEDILLFREVAEGRVAGPADELDDRPAQGGEGRFGGLGGRERRGRHVGLVEKDAAPALHAGEAEFGDQDKVQLRDLRAESVKLS